MKDRLVKTVFHMCSDPGEEAIKAINDGGEDWLFSYASVWYLRQYNLSSIEVIKHLKK